MVPDSHSHFNLNYVPEDSASKSRVCMSKLSDEDFERVLEIFSQRLENIHLKQTALPEHSGKPKLRRKFIANVNNGWV